MTKISLLLCISVFITNYVFTQESEMSTNKSKIEYVDSEYARPSITCLYLESPEWKDEEIKKAFKTSFTNLTSRRAKFFINSFSNNSLKQTKSINFSDVRGERKRYASKENKNWLQQQLGKKIGILKPEDEAGIAYGEFLETTSFPGEIMSHWALQDQNGDFITLNQRSDYNLSADDLKDSADSEKLENFKSLLFKNYILLYALDTYSRDTIAEPKISLDENGNYSALFSVYVYKIDMSEDIFNQKIAPNFKNRNKIASTKFPIKYMGRFIDEVSCNPQGDKKTKMNTLALLGKFTKEENRSDETKDILLAEKDLRAKGAEVVEFDPQLTREEIYTAVVAEGFERTMVLCEKEIDDFKIRTTVSSVLPFEAEVGMREGLEADQRFRIYEYREDPETGEIYSENIGLARVSGDIADNIESRSDTTGNYMTSKFKQTYGQDLKEGMFLVQHNDLGLNIAMGFGVKNLAVAREFGGKATITIEGRIDYNVGQWINKIFDTNLYGFSGHIGLGLGNIRGIPDIEGQSVTSLQLQFGLSKALYLSRKIDVIPYVSFVSEQANSITENDVSDFSEQFQYFELGARAKYPLTETFSIEPRFNFNVRSGLRNSTVYYMGPVNFAVSGRWEF